MSLLAAAGLGTTITTTVDNTDVSGPIPYSFPESAPYNVPTYCDPTPTPDGTGSIVHPSVVDFGAGNTWNGYRYWQANTPFYENNEDIENPIILVSNNGFAWKVPPGLTNPVYPKPPGVGTYNSDTDLIYNPETNRLVLMFRLYNDSCWVADSPDGITWPVVAQLAFNSYGTAGASGGANGVSPSLVRYGPGDWRVYLAYFGGVSGFTYRNATDPMGTWGAVNFCTDIYEVQPWHMDVHWDGEVHRAIVMSGNGGGLFAASSTNGIGWTINWSTRVITSGQGLGTWESGFYRPTIAPLDNDWMQLWYTASAGAGLSWRLAYTRVPKSLWPTPVA